jgi:hypothetical protein
MKQPGLSRITGSVPDVLAEHQTSSKRREFCVFAQAQKRDPQSKKETRTAPGFPQIINSKCFIAHALPHRIELREN